MIARAGSGWQTVLADLALILFMVTAAVVATAQSEPAAMPSERSVPVAIYAATPDAPPLVEWLALHGADSRQQLTITAMYRAGGLAAALTRARSLAASAEAAGLAPRIVIEPGEGELVAALAYDRPEAQLAQGLR